MKEISYLEIPGLKSVIKFKHWCAKCVENLFSKKKWSEEQLKLLNHDGSLGRLFEIFVVTYLSFLIAGDDVKAMVAALTFIIEKAAKSNCSPGDLELEVQQLGLPAAPSLVPVSGNLLQEVGKDKCYMLQFTSSDGEDVNIVLDENKLNFLYKGLFSL
ncbi:unnamed protein product [Enterobius vermicularis]|uniref:Cytochrome P450 n=1 Tax=Enterobius vermicularis TaxID=51028 RepID=A0A0N4V2S1_ENTVE|nr:unnamed protein product [Enterobius vermicularis]